MFSVRPFIQTLLDVLYPPVCVLCQSPLDAEQHYLCSACWHSFPRAVPATIMGTEYHAFTCSVAAFDYDRSVQKVVHFFKYRHLPALAREMGLELAETLKGSPIVNEIDLIVPVPLHPLRRREREYNQAEIISSAIAGHLSLPHCANALHRTQYTRPQASMDREHRFDNVKHAFTFNSLCDVKLKSVAVVDDVLTTGNTLNACARILSQAGADKVFALSIARVSRRNSIVLGA
ncbi:hypothetical protein GF406_24925 [candidate division KSB1 bacterium]|nr:hypothetical protein [candidate division KSB1 bacterium]